MKSFLFISILLFFSFTGVGQNKTTNGKWQLELASGIHSFYAPVHDLKISRPELTMYGGLHRLMGAKQNYGLGVQAGFAKNKLQGNAYFLQVMAHFNAVIASKIEAGAAVGAGYRLAFYPSPSFAHNGDSWLKGRPVKDMMQFPLQLNVGYKSIIIDRYDLVPFMAYQLQVLSGYNPDLSILPVSALSAGIKIKTSKNN